MSQFEGDENKPVGPESGPKRVLAHRLREAGVGVERFIDVHSGTKTPAQKWRDDGLGQHPDDVGENCAIKCGNGLIVLDIDDPEDAPEDLPETFTVESPHGSDERGHLYYRVEEPIGSHTTEFGEVQGEGSIVIGPGSTLDHEDYCDDSKDTCPGKGVGEYIFIDKPIATLSGDHLREVPDSDIGPTESGNYEPVDFDVALAEVGQQALRDLQGESAWTFDAVTTFLQGGIPTEEDEDGEEKPKFDDSRLRKESGRIDRSSITWLGLSLLYSTVERYVDESEYDLCQVTYQTYTHYCREHPRTGDGQKRRWTNATEDWRRDRLREAIEKACSSTFEKMVEHSGTGANRDDNKYSHLTRKAIWDALYELLPRNPPKLSNDMDPANPETKSTEPDDGHIALRERYPGKNEVVDRAYEIDDGYNSWSSYEEAFRRLQANYGQVKAARIGNTWVYYPADYPDPPEANYVKHYGEKYDPEEADRINSWTGNPETVPRSEDDREQEMMTDGGVDVGQTESRDKLEQIRSAREGGNQSPSQDIFECPIDGCAKVFLEESALRNHASQSDDEPHRGLTLNDELAPIEKYKLEDVLRKQYVKQGKTLKELEEEWGTHRGTIHYWMSQHGVERREHVATRVQRASFGLDDSGYERAQSRIPGTRENDAIQLHQLVAIAEGADPEKVFSGGDYHCHHRNGIPWDNRPENVELLSREVHQRAHRRDEWTEEDGFPVLVTGQPLSEEEYHATWGPGVRDSDPSPDETTPEQADTWGPGPLTQTS